MALRERKFVELRREECARSHADLRWIVRRDGFIATQQVNLPILPALKTKDMPQMSPT